jgi:hypothetical protein
MSRHASARGGFLFHAEGRQFWVVAAVRNERTEGPGWRYYYKRSRTMQTLLPELEASARRSRKTH